MKTFCNWKASVAIATGGRHRGFTTFYEKHIFFLQSKFGPEFELLNTHTLRFKSFRCKSLYWVHSWGSNHSSLIGIETQHLFATVNYWLTCRQEQTIAYVFVQPLHPFHQIFKPWQIATLTFFGRWTHKMSLLSMCSNLFPQKHKTFPSDLLNRVSQVSSWLYYKSAQKKHAKHKKTSIDKFQYDVRLFSLKKNHWEAKKKRLHPRKCYNSLKSILIQSLTPCFDMEQFFTHCFCVLQQEFAKSGSQKAGDTTKPIWTKI